MIHTLTNLGDSALLLPASAALLAFLVWKGERNLAWAWGLALALCLASMLVVKLGFNACSVGSLRSPSGHAGFSTTFYGCLALVAGRGRPIWIRSGMALAAMTLATAIGVSRVAVHAHTPLEVLAGWAIGGVCVLAFRLRAGNDGSHVRLHAFAYASVIGAILVNGWHMSPEPVLRRWAQWATWQIPACQRQAGMPLTSASQAAEGPGFAHEVHEALDRDRQSAHQGGTPL